jgi:hypothetical protein
VLNNKKIKKNNKEKKMLKLPNILDFKLQEPKIETKNLSEFDKKIEELNFIIKSKKSELEVLENSLETLKHNKQKDEDMKYILEVLSIPKNQESIIKNGFVECNKKIHDSVILEMESDKNCQYVVLEKHVIVDKNRVNEVQLTRRIDNIKFQMAMLESKYFKFKYKEDYTDCDGYVWANDDAQEKFYKLKELLLELKK